jgi:hypothetical protein
MTCPEFGIVLGHVPLVTAVEERIRVGGVVSFAVMVWVTEEETPQESVAVHVITKVVGHDPVLVNVGTA